VITPIVRSPFGSTSLANYKASEFARSVLAGVNARINAFSGLMYFKISRLIWLSMSLAWSLIGTLVRPGKSTKVKSIKFSEYMVREIALSVTPLSLPASLLVSF